MQIAQSLQQIQPSYIREILQAASQPDVISLAGGLPAIEQLPNDLLTKVVETLPQQTALFQYGLTAGYAPLLTYLNHHYQVPSDHSGVICTGSQQALDIVARTFIDSGDHIVLEAPSYLGALQVFGLAQAQIHNVQQRQDGPDLKQLEALFSQHNVKLFYAVPDFHNPTGICWSLTTRQQVAELCKQFNVGFIEDVPYRALRFSGEDLPLVSSFCPEQSVVLRSFSKIASPGIRLGYATAQESWINAMIKVKQATDLHSSLPMQALLLGLLKDKRFDTHLMHIRQLYQERYHHLRQALLEQLPAGNYTVSPVCGGMFLWLLLPPCNVDKVAQAALENGVAVVPSSVFYQQRGEAQPALRLNFTYASKIQLEIAAKRLTQVLVNLI